MTTTCHTCRTADNLSDASTRYPNGQRYCRDCSRQYLLTLRGMTPDDRRLAIELHHGYTAAQQAANFLRGLAGVMAEPDDLDDTEERDLP